MKIGNLDGRTTHINQKIVICIFSHRGTFNESFSANQIEYLANRNKISITMKFRTEISTD